MGVVWEAEQTEPVRRRVALKLIKPGMDSKQVLARFESERQALAMMNHPNIARVYEAGATEQGRPYFVMELVKGVPVTEYCDTHRLRTRDRLNLFIKLCEGVQHAHQKGIIHRDIKPSNILVAIQDDKPVPKIIDFGVAKAIEQRLTERTLFTELGQWVGTPEYMSPEQAEMSGLDIDTRTDVYSLGAVLYELLVGAQLFDSKRLRKVGFDEMRRRIRQEEPPRPSTRVSSLGGTATGVAAARRTEPASLSRRLRGDLDWIVMKAIDKDRTRRYASASDLAADVERHLGDEPVLARAPTTLYQLRKFVRRNRVLVAGVVAILVVLVAGVVASTSFGLREATQRRAAEEARQDLEIVAQFQADMLSELDPEEMGQRLLEDLRRRIERGTQVAGGEPEEITAALASFDAAIREVNITDAALRMIDEDILQRAGQALEEQFTEQPVIRGRLRASIGLTYYKLGLYERAVEELSSARQELSRHLGERDASTLAVTRDLGLLYAEQGRLADGEVLVLQALQGQIEVLGAEHIDTLETKNDLAMMYGDLQRFAEAEELFLETLEALSRVVGEDDAGALTAKSNYAWVLYLDGRYDESEVLNLEVLEARRRVLGEEHVDTLTSMNNLGALYVSLERFDEAEPLYREDLEASRRIMGREHPLTIVSLHNFGRFFNRQERYQEAEPILAEAVSLSLEVLPADFYGTGIALQSYGECLIGLQRLQEAESVLLDSWAILLPHFGPEHRGVFRLAEALTSIYELTGQPQLAAEWKEKRGASRPSAEP